MVPGLNAQFCPTQHQPGGGGGGRADLVQWGEGSVWLLLKKEKEFERERAEKREALLFNGSSSLPQFSQGKASMWVVDGTAFFLPRRVCCRDAANMDNACFVHTVLVVRVYVGRCSRVSTGNKDAHMRVPSSNSATALKHLFALSDFKASSVSTLC